MFPWLRKRPRAPRGEAPPVTPASALVAYLASQVSSPARAGAVLDRARRFGQLAPAEQERELPALYLLLEQYLVEVDPLQQFTRAGLRQLVQADYPTLLAAPAFGLLFEERPRQEALLCRSLLEAVCRRTYAILGSTADNSFGLALAWLARVPTAATSPIPFGVAGPLPERPREWVGLLGTLSRAIYQHVARTLGEKAAERLYEESYDELAANFGSLESFPVVIDLLPDRLLDERKIGLLSRSQVQRVLLSKAEGLQQANDDLAVKHHELEAAHEALQRARDELELRVAERTAELRTALDQLRAEVDERQRAEERLRQAQKMEAVGQLAGGVAHDFNNLLTIITGFSEILLTQLDPTDARHQSVAEIRRAADRAAALTQQLLAFSRRQMLAPKVVDLTAVVADMHKMLQRLIGEDVQLVTARGSAQSHVHADPGQLQQVILNLAVNARDAMPDGGRLTIETADVDLDASAEQGAMTVVPGPYVLLAVSDTGCGMDEATRARIFEPFFTTKEPGKGTGLGLSTVYGIVKQSDGYVWVYSEPGHGTTFKVYLPRVAAPAESLDVAQRPPELPSGAETILVVEDEEQLRALISGVLRERGYTVLSAGAGDEALACAAAHPGPIDLLLTDVVMPRMGGRELAERLGGARPDTKVLYVSGYTDDAIVRHGVLEAGIAFLQKPFTPAMLVQKVRQVLDAARAPGQPVAAAAGVREPPPPASTPLPGPRPGAD